MSAKAPHLRKRDILRAARRLLVRRSFQDVSMDEVARAAGVAKGTLFLYYAGKEDLVAAAYRDLYEEMGEALEHASRSRSGGAALVEETARAILWEFDRNRDFIAQVGPSGMRGCGTSSARDLKMMYKRNMATMRAILSRCQEDGVIGRGASLDALGFYLFGLCRSVLIRQGYVGGRGAPLARRAREVASQFLYGAGGRR